MTVDLRCPKLELYDANGPVGVEAGLPLRF